MAPQAASGIGRKARAVRVARLVSRAQISDSNGGFAAPVFKQALKHNGE